MSTSSGRSQLGWCVPADDWESFLDYVVEKWGAKDPHVRFELEMAMIEFVDRDSNLAEVESRLREAVGQCGLSSSTEEVLTREVSPRNKRQIGYRIRQPLKDEFKAFVDTEFNNGDNGQYAELTNSHISYGEALAAAINDYRDGGRGRRIRELVELTTTDSPRNRRETQSRESTTSRSSDSTEGVSQDKDGAARITELTTAVGDDRSDYETDSESNEPAIHSHVVLSIADRLPEEFPKAVVRKTVVQRLSEEKHDISEALIERYCEAVLEYLPVVEHPAKEDLYVTEETREEITAWSDLDKERRTVFLRRSVVADALKTGNRNHSVDYKDVIQLFKDEFGEGPSHQYAYDLMEAAAKGVDGFSYTTVHEKKQLRVIIDNIDTALLRNTIEHDPDLQKENHLQNGQEVALTDP